MSATRDIVTTTRRIADAIRATPGVAVIGRQSFFSVFFSRSMIRITYDFFIYVFLHMTRSRMLQKV